MKVLIIPEDPRLDQYMLKPLVEAALKYAGKPNAMVQVCQGASLAWGYEAVTNFENLKGIIADYKYYDVFLLCVDRDGEKTREQALTNLEIKIREEFPDKLFIAVCGVEELEVWVLAGMTDLPAAWSWSAVRSERDPKEMYFDKYVVKRGLLDYPGRGRKVLGKEAAKLYTDRVRKLCAEIQACEI
ncbi:MAG: hypothetical protein NT023_21185 [Armatimonadetes bacterium]|nr:hypothetical protein [Armatimonadota bacterium]